MGNVRIKTPTANGRPEGRQLERCDLTGAGVAQELVDTCKTLKRDIMPDAPRHDQSIKGQEKKFWGVAWEGFRESAQTIQNPLA